MERDATIASGEARRTEEERTRMTNLCVCILSGFLLFRFSVSSFLASFLVEGFLVINPEEKSDLLLLLLHSLRRFADVLRCSSVLLHLGSSVSSRIKIQAITTRLERVLVGRAGHDRAKPARRREQREEEIRRSATEQRRR